MDLITEVRRALERNHYSVVPSRAADNTIHFEDGNLMGFVWAAPTARELRKEWEVRQDSFLKANSQVLRKSEMKAWNLYAVLLTSDEPNEDDKLAFLEIEEDFRAARKIARGGLSTSKDVFDALLPLIPIQTMVSVEREDELATLRGRVKSVPGRAVEILLDEGYSQKGADGILRAYANKKNKD